MRTWLQPVQYRSGRAGKPRPVHLRRVEYEQTGTAGSGKPVLSVKNVSPYGLCGVREVIPADGPRAKATCAQCLRIAAPVRAHYRKSAEYAEMTGEETHVS